MKMIRSRPTLIAHIVFSLDTGGLENGLVNLINRGTTDEFKHMVICLTNSGRFSQRISVPSVPIIELDKPPGHSLRTYIRLRNIIKEYRPSVIHSRNLAALEAQISTLGLAGMVRIHGEHGRDINDPLGTNWKYNALRRVSRLWIDQYFAVSRELSQWLETRVGVPPTRIVQQCNGVDCHEFSPRSTNSTVPSVVPEAFARKDQKTIGTVGRLVPIKDQLTLVRAFALAEPQLKARGIDARLMIVGDGPLRELLHAEAANQGVDHLTWFAGDRDDVNRLLKCMDVFVLPSIAEGVSNTLLEAMATGLPVISTAVGGAPDIIEPEVDGYLVNVGDDQKMAERIVHILSETEAATDMGLNARRKVDRDYSWPVTVHRYLDVYRTLTSPALKNIKPQWH